PDSPPSNGPASPCSFIIPPTSFVGFAALHAGLIPLLRSTRNRTLPRVSMSPKGSIDDGTIRFPGPQERPLATTRHLLRLLLGAGYHLLWRRFVSWEFQV